MVGTLEKPLNNTGEVVDEMEGSKGEGVDDMTDEMTDIMEPKIISEALAVIDRGLADMLHREIVSTHEVADLLLDVRHLLVTERETPEPVSG